MNTDRGVMPAVRKMLDEILMQLTAKYYTLDEFAERLQEKLKQYGYVDGLEIKVDSKEHCVALFCGGVPVFYTFLYGLLGEDREGKYNYGYVHEEYCLKPSPIIWNEEGLRKLEESIKI